MAGAWAHSETFTFTAITTTTRIESPFRNWSNFSAIGLWLRVSAAATAAGDTVTVAAQTRPGATLPGGVGAFTWQAITGLAFAAVTGTQAVPFEPTFVALTRYGGAGTYWFNSFSILATIVTVTAPNFTFTVTVVADD
jgi:hypothetical protein